MNFSMLSSSPDKNRISPALISSSGPGLIITSLFRWMSNTATPILPFGPKPISDNLLSARILLGNAPWVLTPPVSLWVLEDHPLPASLVDWNS